MSKLFEWEYEKKAKFYCDDINSDLLKVKFKTLRTVISVQIDVASLISRSWFNSIKCLCDASFVYLQIGNQTG